MPIQSLYDLIDAAILIVPMVLGLTVAATLLLRTTLAH
jgi:hypothetical protein